MPCDIVPDMRGHEMHGQDIDPLQRASCCLHRHGVPVLEPWQERIEKAKPKRKSKDD